jgi:hypothetical protein
MQDHEITAEFSPSVSALSCARCVIRVEALGSGAGLIPGLSASSGEDYGAQKGSEKKTLHFSSDYKVELDYD